ncbi:MAG: 6-bladed beta-propeller [Candidatus Latescibacteria bacterium]|nr:6-bladed beta-propeller [Candidatus Latescibacterota bacterium]NIM66533.1 6-bladed beta-propeller [Candidatus Latescibacterota bacterium]NIO03014.1 6-bladed beta-propeller [Candidatus Latescibacterota bacterium]NIO30150.1 6-bladed beta-propeller [Candidatus Latescibacterota bacterium]NIO57767.1 6-bladed beta-propeller [Candidatus Latescibacterota bacterium]
MLRDFSLMSRPNGLALARFVRVVIPVLLLAVVSHTSFADTWQGKEVVKDGVLHVMNPAQPVEDPITIAPDELWRIGGDEEEDYFFGVLSQIACNEKGNIYLLDAQLNKVMIFSPNGEYIRSIGREGEGPGEFRRPSDLFLTTGGDVAVMQRMPGKIVLLSPDGEPLGNYPVPELEEGGFQMLSSGRLAGDHVVLAVQQVLRREASLDMKMSLIGVSNNGEKTATYLTQKSTRNIANLVMDEKQSGIGVVWDAGSSGRVYISDNFDAYRIEMRQPDGTLDRIIEREYESRVRTKEEMERYSPRAILRRGGRTQRPEVKASKTDRDIQQIFAREDGSLWVLSSKGAFDTEDDVAAVFDVFDKEGKFTNQVAVKGQGDSRKDGFHIVKDRLYVVTGLRSARQAMFGGELGDTEDEEADEEPMSLICYDLRPLIQSKK